MVVSRWWLGGKRGVDGEVLKGSRTGEKKVAAREKGTKTGRATCSLTKGYSQPAARKSRSLFFGHLAPLAHLQFLSGNLDAETDF